PTLVATRRNLLTPLVDLPNRYETLHSRPCVAQFFLPLPFAWLWSGHLCPEPHLAPVWERRRHDAPSPPISRSAFATRRRGPPGCRSSSTRTCSRRSGSAAS